MKVCPVCGDTYRDHVDFCFSDGAILSLAEVDAPAHSETSELDAPLPRLVQGGQAAAILSSSASTAETMPLPRPVRAGAATVPTSTVPTSTVPTSTVPTSTVPATNAPEDPDDGDADEDGGDRTEVDGGTGADDDPEVTAIRMDEPELGGEATEALPIEGDARTVPPAVPRVPLRTGADTLPLVPDEEADGSEPGDRVAPLAEAKTTPFVRPGVAARDVVGDDTPPRGSRASTATTQLHVQVPKRRAPPAEEPDRSRFLWFGAVFAGIVIAVAFVASMAVVVLIVGVGQGIDDDEPVAIAPRSDAPRLEPVPSAAPQPAVVEDPPVPGPEPSDPFERVASPLPQAPQEPAPMPIPVPTPPVPVSVPPAPVAPGPVTATVRFELEPPDAVVLLDGAPIDIRSGRWTAPDASRSYTFEVRNGDCVASSTWRAEQGATVRVKVPECGPRVRAMVFWTDGAMTHVRVGEVSAALPATLEFDSPGRHRAVFWNDLTKESVDVELAVPRTGTEVTGGARVQVGG